MVEAVLAGEALPAGRLDADEVEALRTAIELRAARPAADLPEEEFVTGLRQRLAAASSEDGEGSRPPVPRRLFLAGAAGAVAAGLVGALAESVLRPASSAHPAAAAGVVVPDAGQWVPVATVSGVEGGQVQRFATATTVGFVTEQNGALSAVGGACTHQGCLLQLNQAAGRLDCPCHRTAFGLDGKVMFSQLSTRPSALPVIRVRNRDGQVEAFLAPEA
jgi:cytochrome b6-f complex iron-sulfur subunit